MESLDIICLVMAVLLTLVGLFISYLLFKNDREFSNGRYRDIENSEQPYYEPY